MAEIDIPGGDPTAVTASATSQARRESPSTVACARAGSLRVGDPLAAREAPQDSDEVPSTSPAEKT